MIEFKISVIGEDLKDSLSLLLGLNKYPMRKPHFLGRNLKLYRYNSDEGREVTPDVYILITDLDKPFGKINRDLLLKWVEFDCGLHMSEASYFYIIGVRASNLLPLKDEISESFKAFKGDLDSIGKGKAYLGFTFLELNEENTEKLIRNFFRNLQKQVIEQRQKDKKLEQERAKNTSPKLPSLKFFDESKIPKQYIHEGVSPFKNQINHLIHELRFQRFNFHKERKAIKALVLLELHNMYLRGEYVRKSDTLDRAIKNIKRDIFHYSQKLFIDFNIDATTDIINKIDAKLVKASTSEIIEIITAGEFSTRTYDLLVNEKLIAANDLSDLYKFSYMRFC